MNNISRNNHFVAQMYLEAWKNSNNKIWTYDLLVPNENCDLWSEKSTKSIASLQIFYINLKEKEEVDEIEKYLNEEFETPASIPLKKAIIGEKLSISDRRAIINYIGCQIVRTPAFVSKMLKTAKEDMGSTFQQTVTELAEELNNISVDKLKSYSSNKEYDNDNKMFPLKIVDTGIENNGKTLIKIETIIGKSYYLYMMKHLLKETIKILHNHEWKILDLDDRVNIPTSDDPVICLNYYADDTYDFGGGWNNIGSEIIFPISPRKIIYTKVGEKDIQFELNYELSMKIKTIIVEHAHRRIFSMDKERWITKVRKRYVNLDEFQREKQMIKNWHNNYKNIESEYLEHKLLRRDCDETRRL